MAVATAEAAAAVYGKSPVKKGSDKSSFQMKRSTLRSVCKKQQQQKIIIIQGRTSEAKNGLFTAKKQSCAVVIMTSKANIAHFANSKRCLIQ